MSKYEQYSKLIKKVFDLRNFGPNPDVKLNQFKHIVQDQMIDFMGTHNFLGEYSDKNLLSKKIQFVHVAGTNGKGSVTKKIETALRFAGIRTGIFISPHISSALERIKVNNAPIEMEFMISRLEEHFGKDEYSDKLAFFEIISLIMLQYFKAQQVEIAVIEAGLGGTYDSTNIINPLLSVITSIGLDHMQLLGGTKREISINKAGIIKLNTPSIIGYDVDPVDVFQSKARHENSKLRIVKDKLFKSYEEENKELARQSLLYLREEYDKYIFKGRLTDDVIEKGILSRQDCRMEESSLIPACSERIVQINPKLSQMIEKGSLKVFLDAGHNEHAISKVLSMLTNQYPNFFIRVIIGLSESKEASNLLKILVSHSNKIYFATAKHERLSTHTQMVHHCNKLKQYYTIPLSKDKPLNSEDILDLSCIGNIAEMIEKSLQDVRHNKEIVLVIGSYFIMKDARITLGYNDFIDP